MIVIWQHCDLICLFCYDTIRFSFNIYIFFLKLKIQVGVVTHTILNLHIYYTELKSNAQNDTVANVRHLVSCLTRCGLYTRSNRACRLRGGVRRFRWGCWGGAGGRAPGACARTAARAVTGTVCRASPRANSTETPLPTPITLWYTIMVNIHNAHATRMSPYAVDNVCH